MVIVWIALTFDGTSRAAFDSYSITTSVRLCFRRSLLNGSDGWNIYGFHDQLCIERLSCALLDSLKNSYFWAMYHFKLAWPRSEEGKNNFLRSITGGSTLTDSIHTGITYNCFNAFIFIRNQCHRQVITFDKRCYLKVGSFSLPINLIRWFYLLITRIY